MLIQPLDTLFDAIMEGDEELQQSTIDKLPLHNATKQKRIDAFYTKDYNLIKAFNHEVACVQGRFLMVVHPSKVVFDEYIYFVPEGNT